jgi:hypothetical protein
MKLVYFFLLFAVALGAGSPAHAYIGPGVGLGAIAVTIALVLGVLFLLVGLVWYPLKRFFKGKDKSDPDNSGSTDKSE